MLLAATATAAAISAAAISATQANFSDAGQFRRRRPISVTQAAATSTTADLQHGLA